MALKIVLLALLVCCAASEAQSQGDATSLPLSYNATQLHQDEATCPHDNVRERARETITDDVDTLLKTTIIRQLDFDINLPQCLCMSEGRRIAYLDMADPTHNCPSDWKTFTTPTRACGRNQNAAGCRSIVYPTFNFTYRRVCGRIIAYQHCHTDAFYRYSLQRSITIDSHYVDGVSITHGSNPRKHVWTFAAAYNQIGGGSTGTSCPCQVDNNDNVQPPPYVRNDYFCDSGVVTQTSCGAFYADDPLWDGEGCHPTSTCCEFNNPPWFCKTLPQPTTDDIEVRICADSMTSIEDTPIELIELYVS